MAKAVRVFMDISADAEPIGRLVFEVRFIVGSWEGNGTNKIIYVVEFREEKVKFRWAGQLATPQSYLLKKSLSNDALSKVPSYT